MLAPDARRSLAGANVATMWAQRQRRGWGQTARLASRRRPGPIPRDPAWDANWSTFFAKRKPVVMGPGSRSRSLACPGRHRILRSDLDVKQPRGQAIAFPRRVTRPSDASIVVPRRKEGAGNAGCTTAPAASCVESRTHELVTTGTPQHRGHSLRNGVNGLYELSPVSGLFSHRRPPIIINELDPSVGGSGPHDFAVRSASFVRAQNAPEVKRPSHPASYVRDDREAPLWRKRDGRVNTRFLIFVNRNF